MSNSNQDGMPGGPFGILTGDDRPRPIASLSYFTSRPGVTLGYASASKFVGYAVIFPIAVGVGASKFVSYAVLGPGPNAISSKFIGYAVIQTTQAHIHRWIGGFPLPQRPLRMVDDYSWSREVNPAIIPPAPMPPGIMIIAQPMRPQQTDTPFEYYRSLTFYGGFVPPWFQIFVG